MMKGRTPLFVTLLVILLFLLLPYLAAQGYPDGASGIKADTGSINLVGITVDELIRRFGAPRSVYAVRGLEEWQDDVVFVYEQGDLYIYKDRVWQVGLKSAMGIKAGDTRGAVSMILGSAAETRGNSLFYPVNEFPWPLMLRCEFDSSGRVQVIFIYRTDF